MNKISLKKSELYQAHERQIVNLMLKCKATNIQSKAASVLPYVKQFMPGATKGGVVAVYTKWLNDTTSIHCPSLFESKDIVEPKHIKMEDIEAYITIPADKFTDIVKYLKEHGCTLTL